MFHDIPNIDVEWIIDECTPLIDPTFQQRMLQGIPGKDDQYGTGRITAYDEPETEFRHPLHDIPYTNSILESLGMYRSRLMIMTGKLVYSWHYDPSPRVHIPLISNHKTNFMVVEDTLIRMPVRDRAMWVDTTKMHTYVNAADELRVHIIGCVDV